MVTSGILILAGVLTFVIFKHQHPTADVRVIIPPPAEVAGLHRDHVEERSGQLHSAISTLRQTFTTTVQGGEFASAIYTNAPAGASAGSGRLDLVYVGVNGPSSADPARGVELMLSGADSVMRHARIMQEGGGPGDTRFACVTGVSILDQRPVVACAWGTDRTIGLLFPRTATSPEKLAALMKKMEPHLVRS